ncbi:MAG: serine hydrolase, partial [Gammaproteobacteria bacterium]|nr:serine hydrolase [Gammaproteobacteria bacterium]
MAVWAPPVAWSAEIPSVAPEQVGLSSERLERLTGRMNALVEEGAMVGGLGLIARRGRVAYEEVYGLADREAGRPMALDTIFRIYSMSKPITSVAVMMLYEEGEFLLNDPVALYLPELADLQVARSTGDGDASAVGQTRA